MFINFLNENMVPIIVLLIGLWIAQFVLAYWQMMRFYDRLKIIRKNGLTAVGLHGDRIKGRVYAVLAVDEKGTIVHAEQFSGLTVFAQLRPNRDIEGLTLSDILDENRDLPVSGRLRTAYENAANDIWEARHGLVEQAGMPVQKPA
ncbi:MAG: transcriptional regulator GutM [Chloroflexota bacterium]